MIIDWTLIRIPGRCNLCTAILPKKNLPHKLTIVAQFGNTYLLKLLRAEKKGDIK